MGDLTGACPTASPDEAAHAAGTGLTRHAGRSRGIPVLPYAAHRAAGPPTEAGDLTTHPRTTHERTA